MTRSLAPLARGDGVGHAVQAGEVLVGERECPERRRPVLYRNARRVRSRSPFGGKRLW